MIDQFNLAIPEYSLDTKPDYLAIGKKLDAFIEEKFPNQWIALRGISMQDHPELTLEGMVEKIVQFGTDRYDPLRKSVHHVMDEKFGIDLHATPMFVGDNLLCPHYSHRLESGSVMGDFIMDCYEGAKADRGYPLRLDILSVYDLNLLVAAPMEWSQNGPEFSDRPIEAKDTTVFRFKQPSNKTNALRSVIRLAT